MKEESWREGVSRRQSLITNKQFYALSSFRISCYTHGTFDFSDCYLNLCAQAGGGHARWLGSRKYRMKMRRPPPCAVPEPVWAQLTGQCYTGDCTRGAVYTVLAYMATVESIQSYTFVFYSVLPGLSLCLSSALNRMAGRGNLAPEAHTHSCAFPCASIMCAHGLATHTTT